MSFSVPKGTNPPIAAVYLNGNIYTVDEQNSNASTMVIADDRFAYVGSDQAARKYISGQTAVFDLKGQTVLPGLIDAHAHYSGVGNRKIKLDAFWKPKQGILDTVHKAAISAEKDEWIEGRGWNQEIWDPPDYPTREDLDAVAPNNPVYLERTDGHAAWVNSPALKIAAVTKDTTYPQGGEIIRHAAGEPTGVLVDTAKLPVFERIPPFSDQKALQALEMAQAEFLSHGLTGVHDAGSDLETVERVKRIYDSGRLCIRLYVFMRIPDGSATLGEEFYTPGRQIGLYNNSLTIRSFIYY